MGAGFHTSFMRYSDLDEDYFPTKKNLNSGMFSLFVQREFGQKHNFAIRPELAYTKRGGRLTEIGMNLENLYEDEGIKDIRYRLKSHYLDIRVPLIYQFGKASSAIRPYVYVAPILGFSLGGNISMEQQYYQFEETAGGDLVQRGDDVYAGMHMDLTKSNMSAVYFAAAMGAGVKWQFNVGRHTQACKRTHHGEGPHRQCGFGGFQPEPVKGTRDGSRGLSGQERRLTLPPRL